MRVPPRTTALGALAYYVSHAEPRHYQPTNITFGIMPALDEGTLRRGRMPDGRRPSRKEARKVAHAARALADLDEWMRAESAVLGIEK
jgi:methylenetetrahydrofolate--tRNA-(uracil-5-)-methyltransferase